MSPTILLLIAGLCTAAAFASSLAAYSLRNYSRSRLAQICRQHRREDRFGTILKDDTRAVAVCEIVQAGSVIVAVGAFFGVVEGAGDMMLLWLLAAALLLVLALVVIPWALSRVAGEGLLYHIWPLLALMMVLLGPLLSLGKRLDTLFHRVAGRRDPAAENGSSITEEIQSVVDEGEREGLLESRAGRMIEQIMDLRDEDVRAVMTPRTEIVSIHRDVSLDDARRLLLEAGHSRVPVIGDSPDDIVGILYAKDLLRYLDVTNGQPVPLTQIVRDPLYIPETTGIDHLLERMKRERLHLAIVLDEYGGVVGLVTLEDILEEIVGEIADEHDPAEAEPIRRIDDLTAEVDARVHLDDLNEEFGFELPEDEDFDTIGGFVFSELGHIPKEGESLTWQNLRLTVLDADKRKINQVRIQVDPTLQPATDEG